MQSIHRFIHELTFEQLPADVIEQAKYCVLDLLGVAAAGKATQLQNMVAKLALKQFAGDTPMLFSDHTASGCGASLYGGMLIDSMDAHDGQVLTKGHVGVAVLPGLLASMHESAVTGEELLTSLVIGYEIATRAGIALHQTACDYHTSGAWNALGVAAVSARRKGLTEAQTEHALGIAEFYGPRSQMMRCIEHPTMLKDGSGWGAMAGFASAELAEEGFTGAPAVTLLDQQTHALWADLGQRWYILEQYFKPYPVCRWAQPAVEAVRALQQENKLEPDEIELIEVHSFHQAVCLHTKRPETTEQAQYSLPFSVASAVIDNTVTVEAVTKGLKDPARLALTERMRLIEEPAYNDKFPAERWAHVVVTLKNGDKLTSPPCIARGNPENPLSRDEMRGKFRSLAEKELPASRVSAIEEGCLQLDKVSKEQVLAWLSMLYQGTLSDKPSDTLPDTSR
ncbi:MmgE/PrpD family protein [Vibrio diabolicus]|uniref:MmgE/PrpD family protein n=1 Tax=Vibrio diabolicus TaxID=50719 RepID=UPI0022A82AC3|nr:MmgE/PrpD family protein [Vibrio diabolicus]MCZ0921948.1 MmgE/PrpD family protein [Vibrio diabolicus]